MTNLLIATATNSNPTSAGSFHLQRSDASNSAANSPENEITDDQTVASFFTLLAEQIGIASPDISGPTITPESSHKKAEQIKQSESALPSDSATDDQSNFMANILPVQFHSLPDKKAVPVQSRQLGIRPRIEEDRQHPINQQTNSIPVTFKEKRPENTQLFSTSSLKLDDHQESILSSPTAPNKSQSTSQEIATAITPPTISMPDAISKNTNSPVVASQTITAPINSYNWADEFSQKVIWINSQQSQLAELHLNPPDLGPLNIVLQLSPDNQLQALFTSPHGSVREAVENALPKLRDMLADNNITLGNTMVSDQSSHERNPEGFARPNQDSTAQQGIFYNAAQTEGLSSLVPSVSSKRHNGILDTFA